MALPLVREIWQKDAKTLGILWSDSKEAYYDVVELRRRCPCALCIDELSGAKKLKDSDVCDTVRPVQIESVGSYALTIHFSDGHHTGIYTFALLHQWSQ